MGAGGQARPIDTRGGPGAGLQPATSPGGADRSRLPRADQNPKTPRVLGFWHGRDGVSGPQDPRRNTMTTAARHAPTRGGPDPVTTSRPESQNPGVLGFCPVLG